MFSVVFHRHSADLLGSELPVHDRHQQQRPGSHDGESQIVDIKRLEMLCQIKQIVGQKAQNFAERVRKRRVFQKVRNKYQNGWDRHREHRAWDLGGHPHIQGRNEPHANPIVFSDWSCITGTMIQRKNYTFDELLNGDPHPNTPIVENQQTMFDATDDYKPDPEGKFLAQYITDYRRVQENG